MNKAKKILLIFGISILMMFVFRGSIFRLVVKYHDIGTRSEFQVLNGDLISKIDSKSASREIGFEEVVEIALEIANDELSFTTGRASNNPNELVITQRANCIGYAAMFNSVANYLINKNQLQGEIKVVHKIGQLYFFGINLHQFFESSFFRDHDYNEVIDIRTGKTISIDPSVSDYLGIDRVTQRE